MTFIAHKNDDARSWDASDLWSRRVLVADDNRDAADSLAMLLELQGHHVFTAYSGAKALDVIEHERPEFIVLDIGMPDLHGYEVARRIREHGWGRSLTLIAHTGYGQPEDVRRAKEAGFDHHLTKPLEFRLLSEILSEERTEFSRHN